METMKARVKPLAVTAYTATTALGAGRSRLLDALLERRTGLQPCRFAPFGEVHAVETWIGEVEHLDEAALPQAWQAFDCRSNRLAWLALQQDGMLEAVRNAVERYGAYRVAVIVGTSTSGLLEAEGAYRLAVDDRLPQTFHYDKTLNVYSLAALLAGALGVRGPSYSVSTACSSSSKVFAAAARMLAAELVDAVLVAGVDTHCLTTLHGFRGLDLLSSMPCRPYDRDRDGISLGEGAGFALLERSHAARGSAVALLGYGESSDAHHMSAPHPNGLGAELAMRQALAHAGIAAADIGYVNLHGTASQANDLTEGMAVHRVFGDAVPTSSTKGWTGHLLGAAGIVEAVISMLAIERGFLPGTLNLSTQDPQCRNQVLVDGARRSVDFVLSNSFGFGGSNSSLVLGRAS